MKDLILAVLVDFNGGKVTTGDVYEELTENGVTDVSRDQISRAMREGKNLPLRKIGNGTYRLKGRKVV